MNPCQHFKEYMFALLDQEIDKLNRKQLQNHLEDCEECDRLMARLKTLKSRLSGLDDVTASENFHIVLREKLRREMAGKRSWSSAGFSTFIKWTPAVGLAAAALIIGLIIMDDSPRPGQNMSDFATSNTVSDPFQGQVQYVIDDYPQRLSISRDDRQDASGSRVSGSTADSLGRLNDFSSVRSRVTPVSF